MLVVCALLAATASATETALTSVSRHRVRHLADEGSSRARVLQRLHQDPNRMLSTVLVVNTLALILASAASTLLGIRFLPRQWGVLGTFLVDLILTLLLLVFSEVTPKTLAIRNAERVALAAAGPVDRVASGLRPVLWFITIVSRWITGGRAARGPYLTEEELISIVHFSEEQGVIEEEEREMIAGIIEIGDKLVREVMVPRTDIIAVEKNAKIEDIVELIRTHGHSRIPVYEVHLDHIAGMVLAKDVLLAWARGERDLTIDRLLRSIEFTPESKKVDELLHEMQEKNVHMMAVVDEYGGTAGIVTHEDLIEEIVGEIRDEYDVEEEEPLTLISEREALVDARYPMEELNDKLNLGIQESEEYDSVGGYVYSALGSIPEVGASFEGGRARWTVEQVNGQRILRVRVSADEPWPDPVLVEAGMSPPDRDTGLAPDDAREGGEPEG